MRCFRRFPAAPRRNTSRLRRLAVALAAVAGFVDAVGYLTLHHLFTGHMTGNATTLGIELGRGRLGGAVPLAVAPLVFVGGVAAGTALLDAGSRGLVLALQALLVAAYMSYGAHAIRDGAAPDHTIAGFYVLATLATLALGLQTAALTEIGGTTVRTTYVSGVLTNLAQTAVRRLTRGSRTEHRLRLLAAIWVAYVLGAAGGSYALHELTIWCLAFPLGALAVAATCEGVGRRRR